MVSSLVLFTKKEILALIPPPLEYRDLKKVTTTTNSAMAQHPAKIFQWQRFTQDVFSCNFDIDNKVYEQPHFMKFEGISDEDCVCEAVSINVLRPLNSIGCRYSPQEEYAQYTVFPHILGEPDFSEYDFTDSEEDPKSELDSDYEPPNLG
ncbi:4601_t:CDS:2 [Entrophospora sp. SA101]|nr:4601_t:CDS:2 [Entrophospora sp. SA101]